MSRCLMNAAAALAAAVGLIACATPEADPAAIKLGQADKAYLVTTVTQDFGPPGPMGFVPGMGRNAQFSVYVRPVGAPKAAIRLMSNELIAWSAPSPLFDQVWGRLVVRELPPGRYELFDWDIAFNTGAGTISISPKQPPPVLEFELKPGAAVYIGNVHARLAWGENFLKIPLLAAALPEVRDASERDLERVARDYPALGKQVAIAMVPVGPWHAGAP